MLIRGTTYDGRIVEDLVPLGNPITGEGFVENEDLNPQHRFMHVIPAGDWTIETYVLTDDGVDERFEPTETRVKVGPGGVRQLNLSINTAINTGNSGNT